MGNDLGNYILPQWYKKIHYFIHFCFLLIKLYNLKIGLLGSSMTADKYIIKLLKQYDNAYNLNLQCNNSTNGCTEGNIMIYELKC